MSVPSFPRAEHMALLRQTIEQRLRDRNLSYEVVERGLNQWKCQYCFGFRRPASESLSPQSPPVEVWLELPIHFQIAQRLEEGKGEAELDHILDDFLNRRSF